VTQRDGDGFTRQEQAVREYAEKNGIEITTIYKEDWTGTDVDRPVLASMLVSLEQNNHHVKTVLIEKLDRLARDIMVQESIVRDLQHAGVELVSTAEGPDLCADDPTRKFIRQVMGAVAEYDKMMLVAKLRAARDRMRQREGRCEGRKRYRDTEEGREILKRIRLLRRRDRDGRRRTLQQVADILNAEGIRTLDGKGWSIERVFQTLKSDKLRKK